MDADLPLNYVYAIAVSPAFARDRICFSAQQSGLFRSLDGGKSWQDAFQSLAQEQSPATHAVAFSPEFNHDLTVFAAVQGGILRSTDGGFSWQMVQLPSPPPLASGVLVSPYYLVDGRAFCATVEDGVFITRDRGNHWATWNFGLLDLQILCLAVSPQFSQDETLIAGAESGIYRSKSGGRAWKAVDFPVESAPVTSLVFSTAFEVDHTLFAGTANGELFRSNDRGDHWTAIHQFSEAIDQILVGPGFKSKPEMLLLTGAELRYSADAGQSWKRRRVRMPPDAGLTCLAAPFGISPGKPLLAGSIRHGVILL